MTQLPTVPIQASWETNSWTGHPPYETDSPAPTNFARTWHIVWEALGGWLICGWWWLVVVGGWVDLSSVRWLWPSEVQVRSHTFPGEVPGLNIIIKSIQSRGSGRRELGHVIVVSVIKNNVIRYFCIKY